MSPAPVPRLQIVAVNLSSEFRQQLKFCLKCQVLQPVDYLVSEDTILQPDLLIVCRPIEKKFLDFPPVLVAEILSASTEFKDRHTKYSIYESQGIRYYLIIDSDRNRAEVYELTEGKYRLMQQGNDFVFSFQLAECSAEINFKEIW